MAFPDSEARARSAFIRTLLENEQRRECFFADLDKELEARGLAFVRANLGRDRRGLAVWSVTYLDQAGETRLRRVWVPAELEPYGAGTAEMVAVALMARP
jgi:hypothetical protein